MNYTLKQVTTEYDLYRVLSFAEKIFGNAVPGFAAQNHKDWLERMTYHPEIMLFAETDNVDDSVGEVISVVLSSLEDNGNITIDLVAADERYRNQCITKRLMLLIEERAKKLGVHLLALGAKESAEKFYEKLGYTGQLLIQSQKHSIDELLSLNPGYPVVFTNVYDKTINQVCLKLEQADRELQRLYESTFDMCYTQMMFWKTI